MSELPSGDIRPMCVDDLQRVLSWRNHPKIRQHMLTQHVITAEEHRHWFERSTHDPLRKIMLLEHQGQPFGLVHFTGIQANASVDWGFYLAPDAPKGSGVLLGQSALAFAFETLHIHKLCGQVLDTNAASIRFHERQGFSLEGRLRQQVCIQSSHRDLLCFGLLHTEWSNRQPSKDSHVES